MSISAAFQTRARAIDHLGRGQIADTPTAVSELWKNSYDAYARNVALHIFDGVPPLAGIYDDGCGMSLSDLQEKWLVVGTESKVGKNVPPEEMFGLSPRVRLGEKGIGRLSAAFLSPVTLIVTKKIRRPYAALLVDWRFFENPFLLISDVHFPLAEFGGLDEFPGIINRLTEGMKSNLADADVRTRDAWERFAELERRKSPEETTTEERILAVPSDLHLTWDHVLPWWRLLQANPDSDKHGTALFCFDCNNELRSWTYQGLDNPDIEATRGSMRETLVNFVDPYDVAKNDFSYELVSHQGDRVFAAVSSQDAFTLEELRECEHCIEGEFDKNGVFSGRVKAFGRDRGEMIVPPSELLSSSGREYVGPFKFRLATIEFDKKNTTHSDEQFETIQAKLDSYGGICLYRDGLRVLPYGRADGDLFLLEERRTKHAGREFFSYRRCCGGIFISAENNPNLKDKAGREGLVANKARRTFERLVINLLMTVARKYFGSDSDIRKSELPGIQQQRQLMAKEAEKARKRTRSVYKKAFRRVAPRMSEAEKQARALQAELQHAGDSAEREQLLRLKKELDALEALKGELRLPVRPSRSGITDDDYRRYRDAYVEFCTILSSMKSRMAFFEASGLLGSPREVLFKKIQSNEARLSSFISKKLQRIDRLTGDIASHWRGLGEEDRKAYRKRALPVFERFDEDGRFESASSELDADFSKLQTVFQQKYDPIVDGLEQLAEHIRLGDAFQAIDERNQQLEEKMEMLHSVAQLGITVEIIGHELEALESQVRRNLDAMPREVRNLRTYREVREAHNALVDRLRFLSPLKKNSYRNKLEITGLEVEEYVRRFFGGIFNAEHIDFAATDAFRAMTIVDLPSRIYPTFINLVNNALYWVGQKSQRIIRLDYRDEKIFVSDSGPGVDEDDVEHLFQMFFTRRHNGRGIGLYLCRENLRAAGYDIRYAGKDDPHILEGANFIIERRRR